VVPAPFDDAAGAASAPVLAALAGVDVGALRDELLEALAAEGVGFSSVDGDGTFNFDPVPRVIDAAEWAELEAGLVQRVRALDAFVADVYGDRAIVAAGVVPARVIDTAEYLEPSLAGFRPPGGTWIGIAGLDVVRRPDGSFAVLEDNVRIPSGMGYAVAARAGLLRRLPPVEPQPRPLDVAGPLGAVLRAAAPAGVTDPAAVVLTDGPDNSAYWEHRWQADVLGIPLVEPPELRVRGDRLELRDGGRPVDVVYRRCNADLLDTDEGRLLEGPWRAGTLGVVNAFGTGVADDKLAHVYVEDMVRFYLGEEPLLPSVRTYDLARPGTLEEALERLPELVVKPRSGYGGIGVVVCAHADEETVERTAAELREAPEDFIVQELVTLSTHPTVIDGELAPRHVDLRPYVFRAGDDVHVLPGGLTRVAFGEGALVVNSSQNGGAKDTWVLP